MHDSRFRPFVVLVFVLGACGSSGGPSPAGDGGEAGRGDRDGSAASRDGARDGGGSANLAASYTASFETQIVPTAQGTKLGLTKCKMTIGATVKQKAGAATCPTCDGTWTGAVTSTVSDCSSATPNSTMTYGMVAEKGKDAIDVWEQDTKGTWSKTCVVTRQGAAYVGQYSSVIGSGSLDFGTASNTLTLTPQ
jgi:hypothetical protein